MDKPYGPAPMMATETLLDEAVIVRASRSFLIGMYTTPSGAPDHEGRRTLLGVYVRKRGRTTVIPELPPEAVSSYSSRVRTPSNLAQRADRLLLAQRRVTPLAGNAPARPAQTRLGARRRRLVSPSSAGIGVIRAVEGEGSRTTGEADNRSPSLAPAATLDGGSAPSDVHGLFSDSDSGLPNADVVDLDVRGHDDV